MREGVIPALKVPRTAFSWLAAAVRTILPFIFGSAQNRGQSSHRRDAVR
jgi:hypothetical protein